MQSEFPLCKKTKQQQQVNAIGMHNNMAYAHMQTTTQTDFLETVFDKTYVDWYVCHLQLAIFSIQEFHRINVFKIILNLTR